MPNIYTNPKNNWILIIAWRWNSADIYVTQDAQNYELIPLIESNSDISWANLSEDSVFILTYQNAKNGRILKFNLDELKDSDNNPQGTEFVEEGNYAIDLGLTSTASQLIYTTLKNACHEILIHDVESGTLIDRIEFSSPVTVKSLAACPVTNKLYISVSTYIGPDSIQTYLDGNYEPFFSPEVNLESSKLKVEQVWYKSKNGTNVPMFLISAKNTIPSKMTQVLIRAYGNGGISYTPMFFPEYMIWLEKGGILAIPSIRGGGEFGQEWHKKGSRAFKQNSFYDFIAAIEWLHTNGYGSPETTAIMGRSAGGLLVGAVLVQRPDLFSSVYCAVPLLDMIRYTKFTLAKVWMSEYGNPEIEEEFSWLFSYSPYHHVIENTQYPAVLLYTALGDIRCDPMHAMKMAARLQAATNSEIINRPIVLSIDHEAGHGVGLSTEKLVEIRTNQVIFHGKHTGLDFT
jgi:prolyl oligopeptidase